MKRIILLALLLILLVPGHFVSANTYPAGEPIGTLIKDPDEQTIYVVTETNVLVGFTSWDAFTGLGYQLQNVINESRAAYRVSTSYYLSSPSQAHPWSSWINNKGTIYYSHPSGLIGIPSWQVFLSNGGQVKYILPISKGDQDILDSNPNLPVMAENDSRMSWNTTVEVQKNCGQVVTHGENMPALDPAAQQAEDCFWTNFQSGTAAGLTLTYMGVDTGTNINFSTSIVNCIQAPCNAPGSVTGYSQGYSANPPVGVGFPKDYFACSTLTKDSSGLHALQCKFKDSTKDILIPSYAAQSN